MSQKSTRTSASKKSKKNYSKIPIYAGKHTAKAEFKDDGVRVRIVDQTCLDTLLMDDSISLDDYKIIDKFYSDYCRSGFVGIRATNYNIKIATHEPLNLKKAILKRKVLDCFSAIKSTGNETAYKILKKIVEDDHITLREMNWIKKNFSFLAEKVEKFYNFWGNS